MKLFCGYPNNKIKLVLNIFPFLDSDFHGYMVKVHSVRESPGKVKYFHAVMHDGEKPIPIVSYNTTLHSLCENAMTTSKPLRFINGSQSYDEMRQEDTLVLGNPTIAEFSTKEIPFDKVKDIVERNSQFTCMKEIGSICVDEIVNVEVKVNGSEKPADSIQTRYGIKTKKEVLIFDDSSEEEVRLSLWNDHISSIDEDGVYKLFELRVKSFKGKYLTTTANSKIVKSSCVIESSKTFLAFEDEEFCLPADNVMHFQLCHYCSKCSRQGVTEDIFLKCPNCGAKSLLKKSVGRFSIKLGFGSLVLTLPHDKLIQMLEITGIDISNTTAIQEMLLCNENIRGLYNSSKIITTVKKD